MGLGEDRSATHWGKVGRVGTGVGLEEDRLDMGGRMLHPKPSIQLLLPVLLLNKQT